MGTVSEFWCGYPSWIVGSRFWSACLVGARTLAGALSALLSTSQRYSAICVAPTRLFLPQVAADCKAFVTRCLSCARKELKGKRCRTNFLKLFPPSVPLEFVAIDILGPLPTTKSGHQYLLIISDRSSKLTRAMPVRDVTAETLAMTFFDEWLSVYRILQALLSDNSTQFVSRSFAAVCATVGVKQLFTSTYHPQTNGQVERFNRTIL
jgi:Integrase core domain